MRRRRRRRRPRRLTRTDPGRRVFYPGLSSNPFHSLAKAQMNGRFGGMVSFEIAGGLEAGRKLMNNIEIFSLAVSLGCVDSLIQHPVSMTHACVPRGHREAAGITDGLIRISVGIENVDDLVAALDEALARVYQQPPARAVETLVS